MFRDMKPPEVVGRLLLHSMLDRHGEFSGSLDAMSSNRVSAIAALTPREEIARKSVHYAHAIPAGKSRRPKMIHLPVNDCSAPSNREQSRFYAVGDDVAGRLVDGRRILAHCRAGHRPRGMIATVVRLRLGYALDDALKRVGVAGSVPETAEQVRVVEVAAATARKEQARTETVPEESAE